jgi:hypothetical protein
MDHDHSLESSRTDMRKSQNQKEPTPRISPEESQIRAGVPVDHGDAAMVCISATLAPSSATKESVVSVDLRWRGSHHFVPSQVLSSDQEWGVDTGE